MKVRLKQFFIFIITVLILCSHSYGEDHPQQKNCSVLLEGSHSPDAELRQFTEQPLYGTHVRENFFAPYVRYKTGTQTVHIKRIDGGVRVAGYSITVLGITVKVPTVEYRPSLPFVRKNILQRHRVFWTPDDLSQQASEVLSREFHGTSPLKNGALGTPIEKGEFRGPGGFRKTYEKSYDDAVKGHFVKIWDPSSYGIEDTAKFIQYDLFKENLLKEIQKTCKNRYGKPCFNLRYSMRRKGLIEKGVTVSKLGKGLGIMDSLEDHSHSNLPVEVVDLVLALRIYNSEVFKIGMEKYRIGLTAVLNPDDVNDTPAMKQFIELWTNQPYEGQTSIIFGLDLFGSNNILVQKLEGPPELIDW